MTTLLPPSQTAMLRNVSKCAAVLVALMVLDGVHHGMSVTVFQMADILGVDPRTISKQAGMLSAAGFAQFDGRGYVLTINGRNTLFSSSLGADTAPIRLNENGDDLSIEDTENDSAPHILCAQNVHHDLIDDLDLGSDQSSIIIKRTKCAQILQACAELFEQPIEADIPGECDPDYLLGWVAKAYADRARMRNPSGLIVSRMREGKRPAQKYLENPLDGMPMSFCQALGMMPAGAVSALLQDADDDDPEPEPTLKMDKTVTSVVEQAWQSVLGQLRNEMPRASFDAWVRDTQTVHWQDGDLTVCAANKSARDWIESRLTSTVERMLCGILNVSSVAVKFVVEGDVYGVR